MSEVLKPKDSLEKSDKEQARATVEVKAPVPVVSNEGVVFTRFTNKKGQEFLVARRGDLSSPTFYGGRPSEVKRTSDQPECKTKDVVESKDGDVKEEPQVIVQRNPEFVDAVNRDDVEARRQYGPRLANQNTREARGENNGEENINPNHYRMPPEDVD